MTHTFKLILALLLLAGCQNEVLISPDDNRPNPDGSVGFRLQIEGSSIDKNGVNTKGTPYDELTEYDSVRVNVFSHTSQYEAADNRDVAFFRDIKLEQESTNWNCTPPMFWPMGQMLSFFAYSSDIPFADAGISFKRSTGESPIVESILYKVPSDVNKQPDLLVSAKLDQTEVNNVSLIMKHALSCISFVGTAPKKGAYVKSVTLRNVYSEGTLPLNDDTIAWTPTGSKGATVFVAGIDTLKELEKDPLKNDYLMTDSGYLMMIPQELKDAAIDVLYWNKKDDTENKVITYMLPIDDELYATWKPGLKYIYRFNSQSKEDITVVYYEKYEGRVYGFQSNKSDLSLPPLDDAKEIIEAGYGVLSKSEPVTTIPKIKLGLEGTPITAIKVNTVVGEYNLYAVSQTGINSGVTFDLPETANPVEVYFDGSSVPCGKIIPHFAKGVSDVSLSNYAIRTPQQMRNISALTIINAFNSNATQSKVFEQERDLDFSKPNIGGGALSDAVVDETFSGTYNGGFWSISSVTISAPGVNDVGLFSQNAGILNDITLKASSIEGGQRVGGIAGKSWGDRGAVNRPRIIGTANSTQEQISITGTSYVGGIVGDNQAKVLGNDAYETATEITVAEVSGWVNITGTGDYVGGIVGGNGYASSISRVLVNGVYVTGSAQEALTQSKIVIKGKQYVGGIAGNNATTIDGNITGSGASVKNMPDVAGIVEIRGTNWVGGITGINSGKLNSVNIRLGRTPALIIHGESNVGGIVGENQGTLGVQSTNTFISTRGNIAISGVSDVGGIVGKNSSNAELENCFVYDFYSQNVSNRVYYAPTITASGSNVGGIAGSSAASITNCSVFSASNTATSIITITAKEKNAGGLVGENSTGSNTTNCSLVGKVQVEANEAAGGILGDNKTGTTITDCWVGNSDGNSIIEKAEENLGLVITPPEISAPSYEIPFITGGSYIGGVVGLNDGGIIKNIKLTDNVTIGRKDIVAGDGSNWVGGIAGGNTPSWDGLASTIENCSVENTEGKTITIQGARNLGGIVGLNNGIVRGNKVSGIAVNPLKIIGLGTVGGIVGQGGSNLGGTGNEYTLVEGCSVTGYVTIQGNITASGYPLATEVGGIIGLNGVAADNFNNVRTCIVKGSEAGSISISCDGTTGGIAGTNSGNLYKCEVSNAYIKSTGAKEYSWEPNAPKPYAGGIAGMTTVTASTSTTSLSARSNIDECIVYSTVNIDSYWFGYTEGYAGALIGYLNATVVISLGNSSIPNKVNNTNVKVNTHIPILNNYVVGFTTGEGDIDKATIHHTVVP